MRLNHHRVGAGARRYVLAVSPEDNRVVVGSARDLERVVLDGARAEDLVLPVGGHRARAVEHGQRQHQQVHAARLHAGERARTGALVEDEARRGDVNLMPAIVEAVEAYATIGEMCGILRRVYGEYREPLAV